MQFVDLNRDPVEPFLVSQEKGSTLTAVFLFFRRQKICVTEFIFEPI